MVAGSPRVWDYVVFISLTSLSLGTGLYLSLRKRSRLNDKDETFLGSRTMHAFPLALSTMASNITALGIIAFVSHYYVYGFHTLWAVPAFVPGGLIITYLFLPVLYKLKVTSMFEYLRMRYGNGIGIVSSIIYFVLSQAVGAAGIYSAALAMSTVFPIPQVASSIILGVAGTTYTALGGLRSVVWADCIQAVIMVSSPVIIIGKIIYDSAHTAVPLRPLSDFNITAYFLRTDVDVTNDETVWSVLFAAFPYHLMRLGLDQMITQRFLAARSLRDARLIALGSVTLFSIFYLLVGFTALAILYWFRDCDPVISGSVSRYDQIVPYYIKKNLGTSDGVQGLFLAGVVSASISTVSSIVNSHAAVLFIDIVSPYFVVPEKHSALVMISLATASGTIMTLLGLTVPYIGSAARVFIALYSAASGPFTGILILAFLLPWANARGTATAAMGVFIVQIWQTVGRFSSQLRPPAMNYTVDRCPGNYTPYSSDSSESLEVFPLYRLSSYWCCLFSALTTVSIGLILSLIFGRWGAPNKNALKLTNPLALKFWRRVGILRRSAKEAEQAGATDYETKVSPFEVEPLQRNRGVIPHVFTLTNET
ncbi:sodium-coupled monocarboxylate transporter 2-like isoform X1 [Haemaphysalis longicornis]